MDLDMLYAFNSVVITICLFFAMVAVNEVGYRTGRHIQNRTDTESRTLTGSVQASILGLLALLLGFTFSMSMQRFDQRAQALISEATAINETMLHADRLPAADREKAHDLIATYLDLRIEMNGIDLTLQAERQKFRIQVTDLQRQLWELAANSGGSNAGSAFNAAIATMIEAQHRRNAQQMLHVPQVVLFLLFLVFVSAGGILGYSAGLTGSRILVPTALVSLLISLIVFIIIDLDRPKRGLIQTDPSLLLELRSSL